MATLEEKIKKLSQEECDYIEKLIDIIIKSQAKSTTRKFKLDWRGCMKEDRDKFTSVELQHKINEWRSESVIWNNIQRLS